MKKLLLKILLSFIVGLIWAIYPATKFIIPLISFWAKKRREFELKNLTDPRSKKHDRADFCFEVSSEGELEQVLPLLEIFLQKKKIIELVYSSESVEKKIQALAEKFPNLFIYRLPLLTFSPWINLSWIKADTLILCRYDFYPHLILKGLCLKKLILLSGSLKGKKNPSSIPYEFFDLIVCASDKEKSSFEKLLGKKVPLITLDLRVLRIFSRLEKSTDSLERISNYLEKIKIYPKSKRIILGSVYPEEMEIFKNEKFVEEILQGKIEVCIAPHKLNGEFVEELVSTIPEKIPVNIIKGRDSKLHLGVSIVVLPGILCELYTQFGHAFVGGGHIKSVHSLLEPYLAGANIYCGPKINRSTEFDFIKENSPENISVVTDLKDLYDYLSIEKKEIREPENATLKDVFFKLVLFLEK